MHNGEAREGMYKPVILIDQLGAIPLNVVFTSFLRQGIGIYTFKG